MNMVNFVEVAGLDTRALSKGDKVTTSKGTFEVIGNGRRKRQIRFKGEKWSYTLIRDYKNFVRVIGG